MVRDDTPYKGGQLHAMWRLEEDGQNIARQIGGDEIVLWCGRTDTTSIAIQKKFRITMTKNLQYLLEPLVQLYSSSYIGKVWVASLLTNILDGLSLGIFF